MRLFHTEEGKFLTGEVHPDHAASATRTRTMSRNSSLASPKLSRTPTPENGAAAQAPQLVFLRVSQQANKYEATSSKGLWEVEVVGFPRTFGAVGRY